MKIFLNVFPRPAPKNIWSLEISLTIQATFRMNGIYFQHYVMQNLECVLLEYRFQTPFLDMQINFLRMQMIKWLIQHLVNFFLKEAFLYFIRKILLIRTYIIWFYFSSRHSMKMCIEIYTYVNRCYKGKIKTYLLSTSRHQNICRE